MDSISNSGISLILNSDTNVVNNNHHQHDLSTCEEEFENQEEIQQMLVNAFDSQSLSNTDNGQHFSEDDDNNDENEKSRKNQEQSPILTSIVEYQYQSGENDRIQKENELLRQRLTECLAKEELYRTNTWENERKIRELNENYERKIFSLRLDYETKIEKLTSKTNEQHIEMLTLKQMYETILDEKRHADEQINEIRFNESSLQATLDKLQIEYDEFLKLNKKPVMINALVQTEPNCEVEDQLELLKHHNMQLIDELTSMSNQINQLTIRNNEREQFYFDEKVQYEKHMKELYTRPIMISTKIQTDCIEDDRKLKQLQNELDDYKLKLSSKQMEINSLKFDFDCLKQEMSDRLSLLTNNATTEKLTMIISERDNYLDELNKLKAELPNLKQQMIDSFQKKVMLFKEDVKKSLTAKDDDYRKKLEQIENEYISQYEQVLEKNKQIVRSLLTSKQDEFNAAKTKIIAEYEEKLKPLQTYQLSNNERRMFEQEIEELTRTNEKYCQLIAKHDQEHRQKQRSSLNFQNLDKAKRKYNDEIHHLYNQMAKQNQQQILLIDEHQQQIQQLKNTYDQRYRVLLDEWKLYNNELHDDNTKLKAKLKEYEKTIVRLRYHIINLQIEYLQNGGNSNKIIPIPIPNDIKS